MTAADSLAAYTHAVELVGLMMRSPTRESADRLYTKTLGGYWMLYGKAHANEVQRQAGLIVAGAQAVEKGVEP